MKNQESNVLAQPFHGRSVVRGVLAALCLFLLTFASASAVDLFVSGILTPAAANGRYVPNGTYSGYDSWVHESGGYYIYNDFYSTITPALRYWNIDNDLNDEGSPSVYFFSSNNSDGASPALVTSWGPDMGTGTPIVTEGSAYPEIDIQGNNVTISDGSAAVTLINHSHFGAVDLAAGSVTRTFTIRNLGAAALTLSGASPYVAVSGVQAANFIVSAAPAASIPAAGSTTFQVTFTPTAAGNHNATLSIASDDADESPYTFAILGRGFTPRDLVVAGITAPTAANGTYLHQGVIFDMEYWKHETLGYYLFNDEYEGTRYWNIDVDTDDSDTDYLFYFASEAGTPVGLTGWSRGTGITGDPLINEANPAPDIMVRGNGVAIVDDDASPAFADHTQFGSLTVSSGSRARTFTIENTGNAVLTLTGPSPYVAVSGAAAGDFSVTTPPAATIAAYGSTTFTVTFDAAAEGARSATLSIASDDDDESPYNFSIQGNGVVAKNLIVSGITAPAAANGTYIYQGILNEFPYWLHEAGGYYIYNDDYSGSRYWNIDVDMDDTTSLFYSTAPSEASAPISVPSWFVVAGSSGTPVIAYAGPEIVIEGNSVAISDGDATPSATDHTDFGSIALSGGSLTRTFTIRNSGSETLTLMAASPFIAIGGDAAADFSVTALPESSIAAGSTPTFT
ncbi:MAG: choice-of-anchor D domain-containing protein, partial [candidate division Zixibacteria bacterium]|nr:choice-of-anchor D domain-containing protein [candidate division Zixibacteria bacterium]